MLILSHLPCCWDAVSGGWVNSISAFLTDFQGRCAPESDAWKSLSAATTESGLLRSRPVPRGSHPGSRHGDHHVGSLPEEATSFLQLCPIASGRGPLLRVAGLGPGLVSEGEGARRADRS